MLPLFVVSYSHPVIIQYPYPPPILLFKRHCGNPISKHRGRFSVLWLNCPGSVRWKGSGGDGAELTHRTGPCVPNHPLCSYVGSVCSVLLGFHFVRSPNLSFPIDSVVSRRLTATEKGRLLKKVTSAKTQHRRTIARSSLSEKETAYFLLPKSVRGSFCISAICTSFFITLQ